MQPAPRPPTDALQRRAAIVFWTVWSVALLLKLQLATLEGTIDVPTYAEWGATLSRLGFAGAYNSSELYTITPLAAGYAAMLHALVGPDGVAFGFLLRLPGIVAESIFAIVLWRRLAPSCSHGPVGRLDADSRERTPVAHGTPRRATGPWLQLGGLRAWVPAIFVFNPVTLAVTGFHGNFDSFMAVCVGAALLAAHDDRPVVCGLWLALAANLKVASLLVAPAFFFWWLARGRALPFAVAAAAGILAGWSPGLFASPGVFLTRMLGYGGLWGTWGISRLLYLSGLPDFHTIQYVPPSADAKLVAAVLKLIVVAVACSLAWRRRAVGLAGTVAATWTVFYVFAPAGAAQYTLWLVLPLLLYNARLGLAYLAAATPFMVIFYPKAFAMLLGFNPYPALVALWPSLDFADIFSWTQPALILWGALVALLFYKAPRWWGARDGTEFRL
jgi:hypothetical protein